LERFLDRWANMNNPNLTIPSLYLPSSELSASQAHNAWEGESFNT
jgi:hypothetical protein